MDVISKENIIIYESLLQEAELEYYNIVDSKRWKPDTRKEKSQDQTSLPKAYTVAIEKYIIKSLKKAELKILYSGVVTALDGTI